VRADDRVDFPAADDQVRYPAHAAARLAARSHRNLPGRAEAEELSAISYQLSAISYQLNRLRQRLITDG